MVQLGMVTCTFITLIILGYRYYKNHPGILRKIKYHLTIINQTYKSIFTEKSPLFKFLQAGLFLGAECFIIMAVIVGSIKYFSQEQTLMMLIFTSIAILTAMILIHLLVGYIILTINHMEQIISTIEDRYLKMDWLLSYFILSMYMTLFIIAPHEFSQNIGIGLMGLAVCYYLNLKVLFRIIADPRLIHRSATHQAPKANIFAALIILGMIMLNLFLAVVLINAATPDAFTNAPTTFDLLYYTCITFLTIGYGDIVPVSFGAKLISIVIGVTSVICLSIFIGTVISEKDA